MTATEARWLAPCSIQAWEPWPLHAVVYGAGFVGLALAVSGAPRSATWVPVVLASLWLWAGVLGGIAAVRDGFVPGLAYVAALVQGLLFLVRVRRPALAFGLRNRPSSWTGLSFACYALIGHPTVICAFGHRWLHQPSIGLTLGPLVVYTVGVLLLVRPRAPSDLLALPLLIAVSGPFWIAASQPEAIAMALSGAAAVWLIWPRARGPGDGPRAGPPAASEEAPLERGWSLDLADEP